MTLSIHRFSSAFLLLAFVFACTPVPPDLTFPETGSSGSASVEVNWSSETSVALVFPSSGGSATVAVKATGNWEAAVSGAPVDWCTFSPSSGASADTQFKVSVSANDSYMDRNCSITLVCGDKKCTVVVTQKQKDAVLLTPDKVEIPAEGGTVEVEVRHNADFTYAVSKSATEWIVPLETRGMTTDKVRFEVRMNPDSSPRQGDISFMSGATGETVHVYQEGLAPCIILTQKEFSVGADGGTVMVELKSNVDFECKVTEGASWLKETSTRSTLSTHTRSFTVAANPDEKPRTGRIVFSNPAKGLSETVTVVQDRLVAFSLSPNHVELEADGGTFTVDVTSTIGYKVSSIPDWIKETSTRAATRTHTFFASANPAVEERSGVVVFCNDAGVCVPVTVSQKPKVIEMDWTRSFYHQSLVERFTATWCQYCPAMAEEVEKARKAYPNKLQAVAIHGSGSELLFSSFGPLQKYYGIDGYPTVIVDGRNQAYGASSIISYSKLTESMQEASTGIEIKSSLSQRQLTMTVNVYCKTAGDYKLVVLLLEDGVVGKQTYTTGSVSDYVHNDIARIAVTDVMGNPFTTSDRRIKSFSFNTAVPSSYNVDNLKILAYVLRSGQFNYGNYCVDNCASVKAGKSIDVAFVK